MTFKSCSLVMDSSLYGWLKFIVVRSQSFVNVFRARSHEVSIKMITTSFLSYYVLKVTSQRTIIYMVVLSKTGYKGDKNMHYYQQSRKSRCVTPFVRALPSAPLPVYREKGIPSEKRGGQSFNIIKLPPPLNLRAEALLNSPLSLTLEPSTHDHHLLFCLSP